MRFLEGLWVLIFSHAMQVRENRFMNNSFAVFVLQVVVPTKMSFSFTWSMEKRIIKLPVSNNFFTYRQKAEKTVLVFYLGL